jgi:hypothetical protein
VVRLWGNGQGRRQGARRQHPDAHSITKVFCGATLASMAADGKVGGMMDAMGLGSSS